MYKPQMMESIFDEGGRNDDQMEPKVEHEMSENDPDKWINTEQDNSTGGGDQEQLKLKPTKPQRAGGIFELKRVFSSKLWQCRGCQFANKDKEVAIQHLKTAHINPQKMKCKYCNVRCYSKMALIDHMTKTHPGKRVQIQPPPPGRSAQPQRPSSADFNCFNCKVSFESRKLALQHMDSCIEGMKCNHCDKTFPRVPEGYLALKNNVRDHAKVCPNKPAVVPSGKGEISCQKCGMKFKYTKWLETHSKMCVQELDCSYCGKTFNRGQQTLASFKKCAKDHERTCAFKTDAQRHKIKRCKYCDKDFSKHFNLKRHLKTCSSRDGQDQEEYNDSEEEEELYD